MSRNIYAFTALPGSYKYYPQYLSINKEDNGKVSVTVRPPEKPDGACGNTARMELTEEEFVYGLIEALKR